MDLKSRKLVFTGGGTAGHCIPNIPIIKQLQSQGAEVVYMGSIDGPEKGIIAELNDLKYIGIRTDKLRRYFSWKNFMTPFNVIIGFFQSFFHLLKIKPSFIFSKGGFVSIPVVMAGALLRIPVVAHESDLSPGLANRLASPFFKVLCTATPIDWMINDDKSKMVYTGMPLRKEILSGRNYPDKQQFNINESDKVLFVFGGSLGAKAINETIWELLPKLLKKYIVIHAVGKGNINNDKNDLQNYYQLDYIKEEMGPILRRADAIVCRAGMTTLLELIAISQPAILVPLPLSSSRGDQIQNANLMSKKGLFDVLPQEDLNTNTLLEKLELFEKQKAGMVGNMKKIKLPTGPDAIIEELMKLL